MDKYEANLQDREALMWQQWLQGMEQEDDNLLKFMPHFNITLCSRIITYIYHRVPESSKLI